MMIKGLSIQNVFKSFERMLGTEIDPILLHSFDVAKLSAEIARRLGLDPILAYIGGFFHDVGFVVYSSIRFPRENDTRTGFEMKVAGGRRSFDMEQCVGAVDDDNIHSLISYIFLEYSNLLPKDVLVGVLCHHSPTTDNIWSQIFYIADGVSQIYRKYLFESAAKSIEEVSRFIKKTNVANAIISSAACDILCRSVRISDIFEDSALVDLFIDRDFRVGLPTTIRLLKIMMLLVDLRSPFTRRHSLAISRVATDLGRRVFRNDFDAQTLYIAGLMHDVGKIKIPLSILHKNGKFTSFERQVMNTHVWETYKIFKDWVEFDAILQIAVLHHERLDGSGYPFGLSAKDLSLKARILQVADVFVALTEDRPYRKGLDYNSALEVLFELGYEGKLDRGVIQVLADMVGSGYSYLKEDDLIDKILGKESTAEFLDLIFNAVEEMGEPVCHLIKAIGLRDE